MFPKKKTFEIHISYATGRHAVSCFKNKHTKKKTGRCCVVAFTWYLLPLWVCHNGSGLVELRKWEVYVGDAYRVSGNKENGD